MNLPHPIPYQGSKRNLAPTILQYFPIDIERLIEPFAGSAAVSILAAKQGKAAQFLLNDINEPLVGLWRSIIGEPETLADRYEFLWNKQQGNERRFYDLARNRFNKTHRPYYLLYLLARCVKASVRYNADGQFNQSPDNRRKGRQPSAMRRDILHVSTLFKSRIQLTAEDYRKTLARATTSDLVYLDPPYQGVSYTRDRRYYDSIDLDELVRELEVMNLRGICYIVSYDGRTSSKVFGQQLPQSLNLRHIEVAAGRSSQATLLGRTDDTYESLYLSPALTTRLNTLRLSDTVSRQLPLFAELA